MRMAMWFTNKRTLSSSIAFYRYFYRKILEFLKKQASDLVFCNEKSFKILISKAQVSMKETERDYEYIIQNLR